MPRSLDCVAVEVGVEQFVELVVFDGAVLRRLVDVVELYGLPRAGAAAARRLHRRRDA